MVDEEQLIRYLENKHNKVLKIYNSISVTEDDQQIIEDYNLIVKQLGSLIRIFDDNFDLTNNKAVKSEAVVLKQDILNYIFGVKNGNVYMIKKYRKLINNEFNIWNQRIDDFASHKDYYDVFEKMLVNMNTIFNYVLTNSAEEIISRISSVYNVAPVTLAVNFMGGTWSIHNVNTYYDMIYSMKENYTHYFWLYENCNDMMSKNTLLNICRYRVTSLDKFLKKMNCYNTIFFDEELIQFNEGTVLLDILDDDNDCHNYKCKKYINVNYYKDNDENRFTLIKISCKDNVIEKLMNIKSVIERDQPSVAVCVDRNFTDLWQVPELLYNINSNYKIYIRQYPNEGMGSTVIYAVMN